MRARPVTAITLTRSHMLSPSLAPWQATRTSRGHTHMASVSIGQMRLETSDGDEEDERDGNALIDDEAEEEEEEE